MTELIKNIKSQFFEFFIILLIPLLIYKWSYPMKFDSLSKLVKDKFNGVEIILDFAFYAFTLYSIITPIVFIIIAFLRKPIDKVYDKTFKRDERNAIGLLERYGAFFQGSLDRASFVFRWTLVILGYLYLFNKDVVLNYFVEIRNFYSSLNWFTNLIVTIFGVIYILIFLGSVYVSIRMVANQYLLLKRKKNEVDSKEA